MKILINEKEINIKTGFRAQMIYERIKGETFQPLGLNEIILFLYSCILSSDKDLVFTFDDYIEYIDNNPNILTEFTNHLVELYKVDKFINQNEESNEGKTPKKE